MSISDVDDIGFLSSLARHLQREHGLSTGNTFVAGFSNGGFMSYTLAMGKRLKCSALRRPSPGR